MGKQVTREFWADAFGTIGYIVILGALWWLI
jgi:hypothetical protein